MYYGATSKAKRFSTTSERLNVALRPVSVSQGLPTDAVAHHAGQRALRAAFVGFFVDMFDMYLPIVVSGAGHVLLPTSDSEPGPEIDVVL